MRFHYSLLRRSLTRRYTYSRMCALFSELYSPPERNFETALVALNSLQSNAATIAAWTASRRDGTFDWKQEMMHHINAVGIKLDTLSVIHVAGTKGKGSTCAFVESILRASGHRTGLYTSPHLIDVRERIRIDGKAVTKEFFSEQFWLVWDKLAAGRNEKFPSLPPFFRFITLVAFRIFEISKIDASIVEVGIGGRTDATNVFDNPVVTGISSLGFDHMNVLGTTLPEIAFEKAGIMKCGVPAFTVPQLPEALDVIEERARTVEASLCVTTPLEKYYPHGITLGLNGVHQQYNAALAIALSQVWLMSSPKSKLRPPTTDYNPKTNNYVTSLVHSSLPPYFAQGLADTKWAGRAQTIRLPDHPNLTIYVDGAHTPESTEVCAEWFASSLDQPISSPTPQPTTTISDTKTSSTTNEKVLNIFVFHCGRGRAPATLLKPITSHPRLKNAFEVAIFPTFAIFNTAATLTKILYNDNDPAWQKQIVQTYQE
eukprot:Phypoly_transcript_06201.p1 GENE.Phypoly_transcript_06201~~Phypoly_transcript_06201.p1  ORF type:complete len:486 (+),score=72.23 Phypoly_transcript_06201:30-1487(+)